MRSTPTAYYWVQKVHTWQAQCFNALAAEVFGAWGDNLSGDAALKVNSPIRCSSWRSKKHREHDPVYRNFAKRYNVIKLQPTLLDRLSAYGLLGRR